MFMCTFSEIVQWVVGAFIFGAFVMFVFMMYLAAENRK